jgi:cholesterol oxidase
VTERSLAEPGGVDHPRFDAIVVGSGFGGSVMACRLAEGGQDVLVLERGRPYPPGSFPRGPHRFRDNVWDPGDGRFGLYDVWSFRHIDAVVASGLGGGSLIYANVLLRMDERWFVTDQAEEGPATPWPITREDLEPYYDGVERMLRPTPYPIDSVAYADTPKTHAFFDAARQAGLQPFLPPIAVTFSPDGEEAIAGEPIKEGHPNLHGRTRTTCRMCGECDVGCNFGSKNTLDYTYLSAAQRIGVEIWTGCEAVAIEPRAGGGYAVTYLVHGEDSTDERRVSADRVIVSAGTLGTTNLLLRSRERLPGLSATLGTRFSGNGDLLMLATGTSSTSDGTVVSLAVEPTRGPVITAAARVADRLDGGEGRGFYLEEGGFPDFVSWILQEADSAGPIVRAAGRTAWRTLRHRRPRTEIGGELGGLFGGGDRAARILPLLGMGRDVPDGRLWLRDGMLDIDWTPHTSRHYFVRVRETAGRMAEALGARLVDNPAWLAGKVITVHPLGGCPMAIDAQSGVVDDEGRVFGHPGLYVVDGSMMPGPVGANPSMTIAAVAERAADRLLERSARA